MTDDPWHYARKELAARILAALAAGPAQALTLFAPRRTGKTEFLLDDLGPLAQSEGHRVVYASFWQAPLSPLAVLVHSLEESRKRGTLRDRARSVAARLTPKLKLSVPILGTGAKGEIDLTSVKGDPPAELLLHLDDLLGRLANDKKPTLIFLDEIQELARDAANRSLVAALRTSLDKRKTGLKAVFTGSSREGLQAMFNAREAPFFHFATPIDLPLLGEEFVAHVIATFERMAKRKIDRKDALHAFEALHRNPEYFRGLIETMMLNDTLDMKTALGQLRERIARDQRYPETWLKLSPIQQATVVMLARGARKPFSQSTRAAIGRAIGEEAAPSIPRVQAALRKLANLGLTDRWTGDWVLEDPEFAAWVGKIGQAPGQKLLSQNVR